MEKLEVKTAEFVSELEMRCKGRCGGACSCPTGHCRCGTSQEIYSTDSQAQENELISANSYQFRKAA